MPALPVTPAQGGAGRRGGGPVGLGSAEKLQGKQGEKTPPGATCLEGSQDAQFDSAARCVCLEGSSGSWFGGPFPTTKIGGL